MGSHSRVSRPSTNTEPASGSSSRLINFSSVLLPAPLRPTSASTSPASTVRLNRSRTGGAPGRANETLRNSIAGAGIAYPTLPRNQSGIVNRRTEEGELEESTWRPPSGGPWRLAQVRLKPAATVYVG